MLFKPKEQNPLNEGLFEKNSIRAVLQLVPDYFMKLQDWLYFLSENRHAESVMDKPKIIAIVGPTATGKSDLAVEIAKQFNGEVISADSRQVYRGLDIGSGKITKREMRGVPHHLLDVANPKKVFSATDYKRLAVQAISDIIKHRKLPIICGGTGFYIDALMYAQEFPGVPPNNKLRDELEQKSISYLRSQLKKLDPDRAKTVDLKNKRRVIRAIEIAKALGKVPKIDVGRLTSNIKYRVLFIGLDIPDDEIKTKIKKRLKTRMRAGMLAEVRKLQVNKVSWKRLDQLGLEYRYLSRHLRGFMSKEEMLQTLETKIWQYAKRQRTWFKRNKNIHWYSTSELAKIKKRVRNFV